MILAIISTNVVIYKVVLVDTLICCLTVSIFLQQSGTARCANKSTIYKFEHIQLGNTIKALN